MVLSLRRKLRAERLTGSGGDERRELIVAADRLSQVRDLTYFRPLTLVANTSVSEHTCAAAVYFLTNVRFSALTIALIDASSIFVSIPAP